MNILHYSLGFPPYRTGGLTKFCVDLMVEQCRQGHNVSLLWPGKIKLIHKKIKIVKSKAYNIDNFTISNFELINPLPISLDEGVYDTNAFMQVGSENVYITFLKNLNPNVIHVHTFMGLHKEFLSAAKKLNIRLVFTTHDFFPMCPKVTLFREGRICTSMFNCKECSVCNHTALSKQKIYILQSRTYRKLKNNYIVKILRSRHRNSYFTRQVKNDKSQRPKGKTEDYIDLRSYYHSMLKMFDFIHYNSTVAKKVYRSIFKSLPQGIICPVSHSGIQDNKNRRKYNSNELKIRYLGQPSGAKGYFVLKNALDYLYKEEKMNVKLYLHFTPPKIEQYMYVENSFNSTQLKSIFDNTDILVAPSIWFETFGFTVLEALSFGVPVVISNTVGAKDILNQDSGIVLDKVNKDELVKTFKNLDERVLDNMNKAIVDGQKICTISDVATEIFDNCYL